MIAAEGEFPTRKTTRKVAGVTLVGGSGFWTVADNPLITFHKDDLVEESCEGPHPMGPGSYCPGDLMHQVTRWVAEDDGEIVAVRKTLAEAVQDCV